MRNDYSLSARPFTAMTLMLAALGLSGCATVTAQISGESDPVVEPGGDGPPAVTGDETFEDLEGLPLNVVLLRATADYDENFLGLLVSEESVTLGEGYFSGGARDKVITLDGVPLVFTDGVASHMGQTFERYTYLTGETALIEGIFTYDGTGKAGKDIEALYLIGFETPPDVIAGRGGAVIYRGQFSGYGHVADGGRTIVGSEIFAGGDIALLVDFSSGGVSGSLSGQAEFGEGVPLAGSFEGAEIGENGFAATLVMVCPEGATCDSASSLGGTFFGVSGSETAGLIGFDETQSSGTRPADTLRYVGAAGFSAMEEPAEP